MLNFETVIIDYVIESMNKKMIIKMKGEKHRYKVLFSFTYQCSSHNLRNGILNLLKPKSKCHSINIFKGRLQKEYHLISSYCKNLDVLFISLISFSTCSKLFLGYKPMKKWLQFFYQERLSLKKRRSCLYIYLNAEKWIETILLVCFQEKQANKVKVLAALSENFSYAYLKN